MTESRDDRIKRLRYRAWRRGFKEADLILGGFADAHLADLGDRDLDSFERLLGESDQDLYAWAAGREAPPPAHDHKVMALIKSFGYLARSKPGDDTP